MQNDKSNVLKSTVADITGAGVPHPFIESDQLYSERGATLCDRQPNHKMVADDHELDLLVPSCKETIHDIPIKCVGPVKAMASISDDVGVRCPIQGKMAPIQSLSDVPRDSLSQVHEELVDVPLNLDVSEGGIDKLEGTCDLRIDDDSNVLSDSDGEMRPPMVETGSSRRATLPQINTIKPKTSKNIKNTKTKKNIKNTKTIDHLENHRKVDEGERKEILDKIVERESKTLNELKDAALRHLDSKKKDSNRSELVANITLCLHELTDQYTVEELQQDIELFNITSDFELNTVSDSTESVSKRNMVSNFRKKMVHICKIKKAMLGLIKDIDLKLSALDSTELKAENSLKLFEDTWEAQAYSSVRKRVPSDDPAIYEERSLACIYETNPAESMIAAELSEINRHSMEIVKLAKHIESCEFRSSLRMFMYEFYLRVNQSLRRFPTSDHRALYRDWHNEIAVGEANIQTEFPENTWEAQSGVDSMIRQFKIMERIDANQTQKGLGKSRKSGHSGTTSFKRPTESCTAERKSSYTTAARDKFRDSREAKRSKFEAQALMSVGLDNSTRDMGNNLIDQLETMNKNGLNVHVDIATAALDKIRGFMESQAGTCVSISVGLLAATAAYYTWKLESPIWKFVAGLISCYATFITVDKAAGSLLSMICSYARRDPEAPPEVDIVDGDEVHAQSGKDTLVQTVLTYVYATMFKSAKTAKDPIKAFLKEASDVPKWSKGLDTFMDYILKVVQSFLGWLSRMFGTEEYIIQQQPHPEAYEFAKQTEELITDFNNGLDYNHENAQRYFLLVERGRIIQSKISDRGPDGREARNVMIMAQQSMKDIGRRFARANITRNGPRVTPLGVMIAGPSGIGKTDMMQFLMNEVTAQVIPDNQLDAFERNHNDTTFTRSATNTFFDGYHGQFNVYFDDIGQAKDVPGQPDNEYMEIINMISGSNYPLNMANLEDKGNVNFRSSMVWCTANHKQFICHSLNFNEPFARRWKVAYIMVPKKEYCKPMDDYTLLWKRKIDKFPATRCDRSYVEFYRFNPATGDTGAIPISYDDLVDEIVNTYHNDHASGSTMLELHQQQKVKAIAKRRGVYKAQAGGDEEEEEVHVLPWPLPPDVRSTAPQGDVITLIHGETKFNRDFIVRVLADTKCQKMFEKAQDWDHFIGIFLVVELIEEERLENGQSKASVATSYITPYLEKMRVRLVKAREVAAQYKALIATVTASLVAGKYFYDHFFKDVPVSQSIGGARHGKRDYKEPSHYRKGGDKFSTFTLKPRAGRQNRGHMQLRGQRDFETQAGADGNAVDILRKVTRRNQYMIRLPHANKPMGKCTFVVPYHALCPLHFGERLQYGIDEGEYIESDNITIWSILTPEKEIHIPISAIEIKTSEQGEKNDWCFIKIPEVIERSPNILKYWATDTVLADRGSFDALLNMVHGDELFIQALKANVSKRKVDYENYSVSAGYEYDLDTRVGDCGGLLMQANKAVQIGKILGMHTAGNGSKGFGPRIVRSDLEFALKAFDKPYDATIVEDIMDDMVDLDLEGNEVKGFRAECSGRPITSSGATCIRRSPLHNKYIKSNMAPGILRPIMIDEILVDPLEKARAKCCKPSITIDPDLLSLVSHNVSYRMSKDSDFGAPWNTPKVFDFEEAVRGNDVQFMSGIPRDTSAGYPYKLDVPSGHSGKSHFFGKEEEYTFTSDYCIKLKADVEDIISKAKQGIRKVHVYADFLKDERRPTEKVKTASTRMISSCPLDLLIVFRMYFLDFIRWIMFNRIRNGSAVGVNAYSPEWESLSRHLEEVVTEESSTIAGDYSGFDGSQTAQMIRSHLDNIEDWYQGNSEDRRIRAVLWEEIACARHIFSSIIYQIVGTIPSGSPPTTMANGMSNQKGITVSFIHAYLDYNSDSDKDRHVLISEALKLFNSDVRFVVFGDDNVITVSPTVKPFFNQRTIARYMAQIGFTYTTEAKDDVDVGETRPLHAVSFLKRGFKRSPIIGRRICPLELSVILEMPQWTTKSDRCFFDVRTNVDTALKELSLHEREVFDKYSKLILRAARIHLEYVPEIVDYKTLQLTTLASEHFL